jgi:hypothetical protein
MQTSVWKQAEAAVEQGIAWLRCSGIQARPDQAMPGAVAAWYDPDAANYPYYYPEITGYAATTHIWLARRAGAGAETIPCARAAADWLVGTVFQPESDLYPYKYDCATGAFAPLAYTFDLGMILNGLVNVYRETGAPIYREYAARTATKLTRDLVRADGSLEPYRSLRGAQPSAAESLKWSRQSGPYLVKCVLGLLNLAQVQPAAGWDETAGRICAWALRFQQDNGCFVVNPVSQSAHAHPLCYTGEGLLVAGLALDRPAYLEAAAGIVRWLLRHQLPQGGVPRIFRGGQVAVVPERTDALAQTIRLGILCIELGLLDPAVYLPPIERAVERLLTFQVHSDDPRQCGGFRFGFQSDGSRAAHVNAWCTMFAIQALSLFGDDTRRQLVDDPFLLI